MKKCIPGPGSGSDQSSCAVLCCVMCARGVKTTAATCTQGGVLLTDHRAQFISNQSRVDGQPGVVFLTTLADAQKHDSSRALCATLSNTSNELGIMR